MPVLEILWHRHSFACHNAQSFSKSSKLFFLINLQERDPSLADIGFAQIENALQSQNDQGETLQTYLKKVDRVFCSDMLRAMETAAVLYPKHDIQVLPYVGELTPSNIYVHLSVSQSNKPQTPLESMHKLESLGYNTRKFHYQFYKELTQGAIPFPNVHHFFERVVLAHWMNPLSRHYLFRDRDYMCVAVVSHSHFIARVVTEITRTPEAFWTDQSIYRVPSCKDVPWPQKSSSKVDKSLANVGTVSMSMTPSQVEAYCQHHKPTLAAAAKIFDSNAIWDPKLGQCLRFQEKRKVLEWDQGHKHHVLRCSSPIRNIPTLK